MDRVPFEHFYDAYMAKMEAIQVHEDFVKVLEWLADKPGEVIALSDIVEVISGNDLGREAISRALGAATVMTTWPASIATSFFKVRDSAGDLHEVLSVDQAVLDGERPFVIEATGEVIERFPEHAYVHFRIADFEPRHPIQLPGAR